MSKHDLNDVKTYCFSCKDDTYNNNNVFKLDKYKCNRWGLSLQCATCSKNKHTFLKKTQVQQFPNELIKCEPGTSFNKSQYEEKFGGILPLLALLPLIFSGLAATGTVAGAVANSVINKQKVNEEERHNREIEDIQKQVATGKGIDDDEKVKKYITFLQKKGFGFYY